MEISGIKKSYQHRPQITRTATGENKKNSVPMDVKINRALILVLLVLAALTTVMLVSQISYVRNGSINVGSSGYTVLKTESDNRADVADALNAVTVKSMKIDIEVPDYCPVNYKAYSPIAMVYDKTAGEVLYSKNETEKCYPASTAKLMTAAVALDLAPDDFLFVAGDELDLVKDDAPKAGINKCFGLNRQELADGIVLKGGSDVSYTGAAAIGKLLCESDDVSANEAVSKFMDAMNTTARNIGADNTHFSNPDGYYDDDNYTTAKDMMKIAIYASDHKEIAEAASKEFASGRFASGQSYHWPNTNEMVIPESRLYYEFATGLKTGMTANSGYCMAASAEQYGHELICVVMNSETEEYRYLDVKNLFEISFSYIEEFSAVETGET
ncbi:MAG: D-alanyl-D-alanine carboxypeptidase family protein [Oscillospiraceae bacterium]